MEHLPLEATDYDYRVRSAPYADNSDKGSLVYRHDTFEEIQHTRTVNNVDTK